MPGETQLAEDDFWGPPLQAAPRLLEELLGQPEPGLRLWAPAFVALDRQRPVHVHLGAVGTAAELGRLALLERATLIVVDLATGHTTASRVAGSGGRPAPTRLAPPPGFEGGLGPSSQARAAQTARCLLWTSAPSTGSYRVTAIAADRASNDVTLDVGRSGSTVDPAVSSASSGREPASAPQVWPPPDPTGGLPRYDAIEGSLAPPPGTGIVVSAARVAQTSDGAECVLQGALRAAPRAVLQARHGALIPVTLVIVGSESPGPLVVPMHVPSFDREEEARETGRTARFAVDLFRLAPLTESPQTYFVYAFTADGRSACHPVAVVAG
jgi:hypothetical protein